MDTIPGISRRVIAKLIRDAYLRYHRYQVSRSDTHTLKILLSDKTIWAKEIVAGFSGSKHEVVVANLRQANLSSYNIILPLDIDDIEWLSEHCQAVAHNLIQLPPIEAVHLCDDKYEFIQWMTVNGFGNLIPAIGDQQSYPYIVKKRVDAWGKNTYIINNPDDAEKYASEIASDEYFCQALVSGRKEYATHIFFTQGKIRNALNIEYFFPGHSAIKGKDSFTAQTITNCPHLELFADILKKMKYEGLCCFNYKPSEDIPYIIEINPRFGGSLAPYFFSFVHGLK